MNLTENILQRAARLKQGNFLFSADLRGYGTDLYINVILSRFVKDQLIERLGQGIYYKPKTHPQFGKLQPSLEEVAEAIARKEQLRIQPTGVYALNKLGLSTQVPTKLVYLTDGPRRLIKVGRGTILFKPTTPRKLSLKGPISSLVISALDEIKPESISENEKNRLIKLLLKEDPQLLQHDLRLAPGKIYNFLITELKPYYDQLAETK